MQCYDSELFDQDKRLIDCRLTEDFASLCYFSLFADL